MTNHIVHVGLWKTGSTWLQKTVFPTVRGAEFASNPIFNILLRNLADDDVFYESTFRTAMSETTNGRILLSSERLAADHPYHLHEYDPDRPADRLARVVPDAQIVLFTRNPDTLARSLYAQYVKEGGYLSWAQFEKSVLNRDYLNIDKIIKRFKSRFEHLLVLPYEQLRSEPHDCIHRIEEFCDLKFDVPAEKSSVNVSLQGWRLDAVRRWNKVFRASKLNPNPPLPFPGAGGLAILLQRRLRR